MRDLIIAIDGYSSTGKSTLAKRIAKELKYIHIDSGAMYRAITLFAIQNNLIINDSVNENALINQLKNITIEFKVNSKINKNETYLNGKNVENEIREMLISNNVSLVAKIPSVREFLVKQQRKLGENKRIVMDGRDIGTVVFPTADVKIFLCASVEERSNRRYNELLKTKNPATLAEVKKNIMERDYIDSTREHSPLRKANDAIELDNGKLTPEESFLKAMKIIKANA